MSVPLRSARVLRSSRQLFVPRAAGLGGVRLTRVGIGAYALTDEWDAQFSEGRLRTRAHAVAARMRGATDVFAIATAAALHGLPLYRVRSDRVDMIARGKHPRRNGEDVIRHHTRLPAGDVTEVDDLTVTSLERTVFDAIRALSIEAAVVVFDAALHRVAWCDSTRAYDPAMAERFRAGVRSRIRANAGGRGIRQARLVADLADGRAQSPKESVARLWMWTLGVPAPELQYRVDLDGSKYALLDFCWPELRRWAEFDGDVKYTDPEMLAGRSAEQVLEEQETRQRAIQRVTRWRCDRWGSERMSTFEDFAAHLRSINFRARR